MKSNIPQPIRPEKETALDRDLDTYLMVQVVRNLDYSVLNRAYLPKAIPEYEKVIRRMHTKMAAEHVAKAILKHTPNLPNPSSATSAVLTAFFCVPMSSPCEQAAIDELRELVKKDPDVLALKEYFESKNFSGTLPTKPKSWNFTIEPGGAN